MKKRVLLLLAFSLIFSAVTFNTVQAKTRMGFIIYTERFELDENVQKKLMQDMNKLFTSDTYQLLQNNNLDKDLHKALAGKLMKEPELTTKQALLDLSKKYDYDFILLLYYDLDKAANNYNFLNWKKNAQVTLKARLLQKNKANYIYSNDITRNTGTPINKLKDLATVSDVASLCAEKCNEHLFSILELPTAKRTLELS